MITNVVYSALGLCGATVIGSLIGFTFKGLSHKWNDTVLGCHAWFVRYTKYHSPKCCFLASSHSWSISASVISLSRLPCCLAFCSM